MSKPKTTTKKVKHVEKVSLTFNCGESATEDDVILISIKGTGIRTTNPKHKQLMDILIKPIATHMYSFANDIPFDKIK